VQELPSTSPFDESRLPIRDLRFLVIDDNPDGRFLVSKTLLRKFPNSVVIEAQTGDAAFRVLATEKVTLIVCHRTFEFDVIALVKEIRSRNATIPIVVMSGIDRSESVRSVGADAFLTYEEWLMIGNRVADLLLQRVQAPVGAAVENTPQFAVRI
jgi:response regulator RpfG family c-di-GMP phosphodiesterase